MARMFPPTIREGTESGAERALFAELARQLPNEYAVLHGVRWLSREGGRARDGEADFLVAHPRRGVLVLEVKGGGVRRDGATGRWFSRDRRGDLHPIKDPFEQAARSAFALRDKLREAPGTRPFAFAVERAVALPDVLAGDGGLGPEVPRELVIDSADLPRLERALLRAWGPAAGPGPGEAGVAALIDLLRPTVELARPGLVGAMARERVEFLRLTEQQVALLDFLGNHRRAAVSGAAGSGKTLLALEQVRRLARQGFRVLFTCYNKALADWAREALAADLGPAMDRVVVDNYHDLAFDFAARAGLRVPTEAQAVAAGDATRFFEEELPQHLLDALAALPDRFDAVVVDEGQDFADVWWVTLEALLADPAEGVLFVFYDDHQRIFGRQGAYPIPPPHFPLAKNCRTTRRIHDAAMGYRDGGAAVACAGPEGRPPEEIPVAPGGEAEALRRVLHRLTQEEGIAPADIVVLSPRGPKTSRLAEGTALGNLALTWHAAGPGQVRCRSVQAFKGLESPVVVLAEPERAHPANRDALLHVALSRAQHHLVVLGRLPAPDAATA
jgi:molybdopterin-guanine dinucleotide biosynthesis protein